MQKTTEEMIQQEFIRQGWTLSVAESCTGGALAARLTRLPGCSRYFLGSIVAYSNDLKVRLLQVKPQDLEIYGSVSGKVVRQMVEGVKYLTGSDYSIAVSGIAGPSGGTPTKPVGTVYGAIALKDVVEPYVWSFSLNGQREEIIQQTVDTLLGQLLSLIKE